MPGPAYYTAQVNIAKNEDWVVPFVYGSTDDLGAFTPIDLTGSTLRLEIRKQETDKEALVWVDSGTEIGGIAITDADGGEFTITITRAGLAHLSAGTFVTDLVRVQPSGMVERIFEGPVTVVEGTTR
jgi:hypothetical protein